MYSQENPENPTENGVKEHKLKAPQGTEPPLYANNSKIRLSIAKATDGNNDEDDDDRPVYERSTSSFRWWVLFLSAFAMFGSYYCYDNPTALSSQFKGGKYDLNNLKYNTLYSIYSFPNMVLPLFGGVYVDKFGAGICLVVFVLLLTIGQLVFAFACSINSFPLMLVGRFIFGLGGESTCVASSALLGVYFKGKEMAFAMGLNLSLARGASSLNDVLSLVIYHQSNLPTAIWFGVILLGVCLFMTCLMVYLDRRKCTQMREKGYKVIEAKSDERIKCEDLKAFVLQYWLLTASCLVVYGTVLPWNNIGGSFIKKKYGYSQGKANSRLLIPYLISAILTPFMGYFVDVFGRRAELLVVSAISLSTTHFLFAFTNYDPLFGLVILGLAYSIYASAIWPAIALVVDEDKLGTAYGLITAVQNTGLAIFPLIIGALTGEGTSGRKQYLYPEVFLLSLGLFGVVVGIWLIIVDYSRGAPLAKVSGKTKSTEESSDTEIKKSLLDSKDPKSTSINTAQQIMNGDHMNGNHMNGNHMNGVNYGSPDNTNSLRGVPNEEVTNTLQSINDSEYSQN